MKIVEFFIYFKIETDFSFDEFYHQRFVTQAITPFLSSWCSSFRIRSIIKSSSDFIFVAKSSSEVSKLILAKTLNFYLLVSFLVENANEM